MLPRHPTVLHPAEKVSSGSGGQGRRSDGGICLTLNPGCTKTEEIHGDPVDLTRPAQVSGRLTCSIGEVVVLQL